MTKAIPKIGSRKKVRIGLRRNARFSLRKSARRITKGVISSRKASPYAGQRTAVDAIRTVGLQRAEVMVKGAGSGRDAALRAIAKSGVRLSCIRDVTPMPHNGCRPPKKRRL
ncbi:hypothetical protein HU200_009852 [Digitaria exilis]|uniref:Ribosomal protein S11 n=1 Tax=Digitaria exilis TaxID=1010633 RepID=A0A835KNW6_9POAL|nr:hypothetical protein HU200_060262 [Digitaria exilis]KAF8725866.1 hypothetical protein HU200_020430 [Digitaria exilis]KAF8737014.1 hypothetical protein HU200_014219 [Digitaria exilis]KAF8760628.1 hypothetical protein HU200_009915 [Digitaria exilis]KAF8760689.1 hypothetical protein HU200_009978 [Digitaria exilis]